MARTRTIKPAFFTNEALAELSAIARLLFIGLWCIADKQGRLEDRPKRIKVELLPYEDCDVDALLSALDKSRFIRRYEIGGERYIEVTNFTKHQMPHHKEVASKIPPPQAEHFPLLTQDQANVEPTLSQACGNVEPSKLPLARLASLNGINRINLNNLSMEEQNAKDVIATDVAPVASLPEKTQRQFQLTDPRWNTPEVQQALSEWAAHYERKRREPFSDIQATMLVAVRSGEGWTPQELCKAIQVSVSAGWSNITDRRSSKPKEEKPRKTKTVEDVYQPITPPRKREPA